MLKLPSKIVADAKAKADAEAQAKLVADAKAKADAEAATKQNLLLMLKRKPMLKLKRN